MTSPEQEMEQFARDVSRVSALARTFNSHRQAIRRLEEMSGQRADGQSKSLVLSSAWVGFGLARIWPQGPWNKSRVNDMLQGIEKELDGQTKPNEAASTRPKDIPQPPDDLQSGLTEEQLRFVAFTFGVIGGISEARPVLEGPLGSIAELAHLLAPLVCIPASAMLDDETVAPDYIGTLADIYGLTIEEIYNLAWRLGLKLS